MKRCVRRVPAELPSFNCESFAPKNENGPKESEGEIEIEKRNSRGKGRTETAVQESANTERRRERRTAELPTLRN